MAKNVIVMAMLAAVNRRFLKKRTSSIGWSVCSSQATNGAEHQDAADEARHDHRVGPALGRRLDDRPQQGDEARRSTAPRRAGRGGGPSGRATAAAGTGPADEGDDAHRDVDEEHRAPPEVLQQEAADHRADGAAGAGDGGPDADGPAPLAWVAEDVGEQRQGGRHDQRGADAHERPGDDQRVGGRGAHRGRQSDPMPKIARPTVEERLAAEPVAEAAPAVSSRPANTSV